MPLPNRNQMRKIVLDERKRERQKEEKRKQKEMQKEEKRRQKEMQKELQKELEIKRFEEEQREIDDMQIQIQMYHAEQIKKKKNI